MESVFEVRRQVSSESTDVRLRGFWQQTFIVGHSRSVDVLLHAVLQESSDQPEDVLVWYSLEASRDLIADKLDR